VWSRSPENSQQVTKLAQNLPVYQYNIEEKIRSARGFAGGAMLEWISNFLGDLNEEVLKKNDTPPGGATSQRNEEPAKPIPVEVPTRCDASAGRPAGAGAASRSTNDSGARRHIRHLLPITAPRSEGPSDPTRRIPRLARARASARKDSMRWFFTREGENVGQEGLDVHRVSTGIPDRPWRLREGGLQLASHEKRISGVR
jgi:hypothetical protein